MTKQSHARTRPQAARRVAFLGVLFGLALALQIAESMLPPLPVPAPVRLGLSNIVVMYAVTYLPRRDALMIALLKGLFAFIIRGALAGALSTGGGLLSLTVMLLLDKAFGWSVSWLLLSVSGSVAHNLGQLAVLLILMPAFTVVTMLPVLLLFAILTGALSAIILNAAIPALGRTDLAPRERCRTSRQDP